MHLLAWAHAKDQADELEERVAAAAPRAIEVPFFVGLRALLQELLVGAKDAKAFRARVHAGLETLTEQDVVRSLARDVCFVASAFHVHECLRLRWHAVR